MKKAWFFAAVVIGWVMLSSISFGYSGGDGTMVNPYQIAAKEDLLAIITDYDNYDKCFILTADIDMEGEIFDMALIAPGCSTPCNLPAFSGIFDGNGRVIFNYAINRNSDYGDMYIGLFGVVSGQIKNLGLEDFEIDTNFSYAQYIGGLAGFNTGSIIHCYTDGIIKYSNTPSYRVGGLVGDNSGNIIDCYAKTQVSGTRFVGGLAGRNYYGNISNSYSTGTVSGTLNVGGLVGYNISGSDTDCFWDTQTSGLTTSAGGTGKTTAEMQTLLTFTLAGWDFTNETANGTNNYWRMCADDIDYPRLNWELIDGDFACPDGVSTEDLTYFVGRWMLNNCTSDNNYCGGADMNISGRVDLADWAKFAEYWLEGI